MNNPETNNHSPRSFMKNHQFSFRVSKKPHPQLQSLPPEEEQNHRRLEFIRNKNLRRILGAKHNEDANPHHQDHGFHMQEHHTLTIRSYLGSGVEMIPESSKEFELGVNEKTDSQKGMHSYDKSHCAEEKKEETTEHSSFPPFSPSPVERKVVHTIDEMPIPMRKSKRNIFDDDDGINGKSFGKNSRSAPDLRLERSRPTPGLVKSRNLVANASASTLNAQFDDDKDGDTKSFGNNSHSAPDLRLERPRPPPGLMKRRNSVTKFSKSMLNAQFDDDNDDDIKSNTPLSSPDHTSERPRPPPGLMKRRNSVTKFSEPTLNAQFESASKSEE
ncbi:unnamed protein product [Cylindrotheca closterium]|uniref:Uncharacterized protein n=1 Tax=Cylindrotheca closterium TaxID=2856 RepID=A0AAD2FUT3_9STRA|nr:unnamed protein product [Cylindrotheca closterium]